MKSRIVLTLTVTAVLLVVCGLEPLCAGSSVPQFSSKTSYQNVRAKMLVLGYSPVIPPRASGQCERENLGREDVCRRWPEVESCAGTGFARCTFVWRRGKTTLEIRTVGDEREIVDRVRCRSECQ
jgi:hypothetical protein